MSFPFFRHFKRKTKDTLLGKTEDTTVGVQQVEMADARMGILYFLGNTQAIRTHKIDIGLASNFVGDMTGFQDLAKASLWLVKKVPGVTAGMSKVKNTITETFAKVIKPVANAMQPIVDLIKGFFRYLQRKLQSVYGAAVDGIEWFGEYFVWVTSVFTGTLADAIPGWGFVTAANEIYAGVKKGVDGAYRLVRQIYSGWGVKLLGGHPSIIANALARHSMAMIAGGLKDTAVASTKLGLDIAGVATAGAGKLAVVILDILQRIANLVGQMVQRVLVWKTLTEANLQWAIKGSDKCIVNSHEKFSHWFQNAVVTTPIIAALALGSGFAGHPMRFLQLIDTSGNIMTQSQFNKGVQHIDRLKSLGGRYVQSYVDDYRTTFTSDDALVKARLHEIVTGKGIQHIIG